MAVGLVGKCVLVDEVSVYLLPKYHLVLISYRLTFFASRVSSEAGEKSFHHTALHHLNHYRIDILPEGRNRLIELHKEGSSDDKEVLGSDSHTVIIVRWCHRRLNL